MLPRYFKTLHFGRWKTIRTRIDSGFLVPGEIPAPVVGARQAAIEAGDKNGDGKLDFLEYRKWLEPIIAAQAAEGRNYVEEYFSRRGD